MEVSERICINSNFPSIWWWTMTGILFIYLLLFFLIFYLFLAALGLRCCARAFSSCSEQGLIFVAVHGLLIAVASLVAEHRL